MAWPTFGTAIPTLSTYQFSFSGYTFGPGTAFELMKLDGVDMPSVRSGDAGRPRDHGMFVGLDVMGGREVTIAGQLRSDSVSFQHALEALAAAAPKVPA